MYRALLNAAPDQDWRTLIALCRIGGLRCDSETSRVRWIDVNWEKKTLLVDAPDVIGNAKLFSDIAQVFVVRDNARNVDIPLAGLPACQEVIQTVAHLRDEDGHARTLVAEV